MCSNCWWLSCTLKACYLHSISLRGGLKHGALAHICFPFAPLAGAYFPSAPLAGACFPSAPSPVPASPLPPPLLTPHSSLTLTPSSPLTPLSP